MPTILCICTFYKGMDFMISAKEQGNQVLLITNQALAHKNWPWESIDEVFYLEDVNNNFTVYQNLIFGTAGLLKTRQIDAIVSLDDFDVEKGALLREQFRIPGMGQTTARYFRDKLAMRIQAASEGINVPAFSSLFNDVAVTNFFEQIKFPCLIKPRSEASATGIKKIHNLNEGWEQVHALGDDRQQYLTEQFKPGDVYHIDALTVGGKVVFVQCSQYLNTPFEVAHGGGIFRSITVPYGSEDENALSTLNEDVMKAFGMQYSASHTEAIKCHEDGKFYFLETASRVGGAHLAEMVAFASGINLWTEWAKIETAQLLKKSYKVPKRTKIYSGIIISLCSHLTPDYSPFDAPEVVWRMSEEYHVGLIVQSKSRERVKELLDEYAAKIRDLGYHASAPAPDKPTH